MFNVLVVDDSSLMRKYLQELLAEEGFNVQIARDGVECISMLESFKPDAITLDINMPRMDGLTCLGKIMETKPTPVIMVSSLTEEGAKASLEALELGAVDFFAKSGAQFSDRNSPTSRKLIEKVRSASSLKRGFSLRHRLRTQNKIHTSPVRQAPVERTQTSSRIQTPEVILVGVSTGGPAALQEIFSSLAPSFKIPIVVAQHMPARFTKVFSERLDKLCQLPVVEVTGKVPLQAGHIYIAQGDADIKISKHGRQLHAESISSSEKHLWHPSVELLIESAIQSLDANQFVCLQLTGMGNDGAQAMKKAHSRGTFTIAESEETAVIYGMPKELVKLNGASEVLPKHKIAAKLMQL